MSTETTWNIIIKVIEGPIVNHCTTGMKIDMVTTYTMNNIIFYEIVVIKR